MELAAELDALAARVDGRAAVYARRLDTGEQVSVGDVDDPFPTGSAAKILVLLAYAHAVRRHGLDPSRRVTVHQDYRDARPGSGVLRFLDAGLQPTLNDCATLMMIVSDNVATDLLLDALGGPDPVNRCIAGLGVEGATVTSPTVWAIPPAQFGMASPRALADVWQVVGADDPVGERCRVITWRHQHREGFARRVPFQPDVPDFGLSSPLRLWSKAGSYPSVSCEAGLFETDSARWVLTVMADGLTDWGNGSMATGPTLRADASAAVYECWNNDK